MARTFWLDRTFDWFEGKFQKLTFSIFDILLPWDHLEADLARQTCAIDMVDGASENLDLTLFKRNIFEFSSNVIQ